MSASSDTRSPAERVNDFQLVVRAMRRGVAAALLRHKQLGNPIAVWRNGRVEWIPPEEIEVEPVPDDP